MANSREIKSRIKSAKNIAQITKAMEMVSASKMRRAQERVTQSQPYATKLESIFKTLSSLGKNSKHPLLRINPNPKKVLFVVITSDKGLAGALSSNVFREMSSVVKEVVARGAEIEYLAVGRKGRDFLRYTRRKLTAVFEGVGDKPHFSQVAPIARIVIDGFISKEYDEIYVAYSHCVSTLVQKPVVKKLLPVELVSEPESEKTKISQVPLFEPSAEDILNAILPYYIEQTLFQSVLDSSASEHSARMIAMKNATDNAKEVRKSLQLEFNTARQAQITQQIAEIASATMV